MKNQTRILRYVGYKDVLRKDICAYCNRVGGTVDHIIPISKCGGNSWGNLTGSCKFCNRQKGSRKLIYFLLDCKIGTKFMSRSIRAICAKFGVDPAPFIATGYEPAAVRHELESTRKFRPKSKPIPAMMTPLEDYLANEWIANK